MNTQSAKFLQMLQKNVFQQIKERAIEISHKSGYRKRKSAKSESQNCEACLEL